jgi:hypothetical protein
MTGLIAASAIAHFSEEDIETSGEGHGAFTVAKRIPPHRVIRARIANLT